MAKKDEQKDLKSPDEFQKLGQEAVPFIEQHGRQIVMAIGAVLLVGLAVGVASNVKSRNEMNAARDFGSALLVLDRPVNANPTAETKPGDEPPFKSESERDEAIVKSLTDFRAKSGGTRSAVSAALPLAQALLRQGKADEALPLVDDFIAKADVSDPLRPAAIEARGYVFESQKKFDDALGAFEQLARENKTDFMKGMGQYHRARVLLLKGNTAEAAKTFAEIETTAPNTAAARLAKERISLLVAQGVDVPKAPSVVIDAGI
jgi:tetratricopeptide (TPR) repeat protein